MRPDPPDPPTTTRYMTLADKLQAYGETAMKYRRGLISHQEAMDQWYKTEQKWSESELQRARNGQELSLDYIA